MGDTVKTIHPREVGANHANGRLPVRATITDEEVDILRADVSVNT